MLPFTFGGQQHASYTRSIAINCVQLFNCNRLTCCDYPIKAFAKRGGLAAMEYGIGIAYLKA